MKYAGDRPGKGTYVCMTCGKKVVIEKEVEKLTVCPQCKGSMFR
jgi:DNA-directed RNA polymerase subunit RPC12/RpoP